VQQYVGHKCVLHNDHDDDFDDDPFAWQLLSSRCKAGCGD
jgi:hypothetical protein